MGRLDSLKTTCTKMAKQAIKDAMDGDGKKSGSTSSSSMSPADAEAYAKKVADTIKADVRMLSGCMDHQTSADIQDVSKFGLPNANGAGGACTHAMLLTLAENDSNTWLGLLKGMQATLKRKRLSQVPQLSTSRQIDIRDPFTLSNPYGSGKTRSLLIGINYRGQQGELRGCHNDVDTMQSYISTHGFSMYERDCKILKDDGMHGNPDYAGIINGFRWLVAGAAAGDSLFMHYSGHGGSVEDTSGDEADGKDETIVPVDFRTSGQITDDEIFQELVMALPKGVILTVVMDCCHSGSILDLPYAIKADEGTIGAVEAGEQSTITGANPDFQFAKMLAIGKEIYSMYKSRKVDVGKLGKIAKIAMS